MSEWRHAPYNVNNRRAVDPERCREDDAPWPCDAQLERNRAEQMRLRAEAAEAALRDGAIPAMRFAARRLAAIEGERQTADDLRADADKIEIIARAALSGEAPDRDGERLRAALESGDEPITAILRRYAERVAWPHSGYDPGPPLMAWADRIDAALAPSLEGARHPEAGETPNAAALYSVFDWANRITSANRPPTPPKPGPDKEHG